MLRYFKTTNLANTHANHAKFYNNNDNYICA